MKLAIHLKYWRVMEDWQFNDKKKKKNLVKILLDFKHPINLHLSLTFKKDFLLMK
jgi:hypothetical protein